MDKRRKGVYGPPSGKKAVIFVDDLNMPQVSLAVLPPPPPVFSHSLLEGTSRPHDNNSCRCTLYKPHVLTTCIQ